MHFPKPRETNTETENLQNPPPPETIASLDWSVRGIQLHAHGVGNLWFTVFIVQS